MPTRPDLTLPLDCRGDTAPLGILAGGGPLPAEVADAAMRAGRSVFLIAFEGFADPTLMAPYPHATHRLGAAGRILATLRAHNVKDLVLAGPVRRPSLLDLRPDAEGARILTRIGRAAFTGDDGLLAAIVRVLGEEGFTVHGAHEIADVTAPTGLLTRAAPDATAMADITRGIHVLRALGAADVGQACVVQQGIVLALEAIEGTDAMLARTRSVTRPGPAPILIKLAKPAQDRRADLPTLGPQTVANAHTAGLRGIAFEAHNTILLERGAMIQAANQARMFLLALDPAKGDPA